MNVGKEMEATQNYSNYDSTNELKNFVLSTLTSEHIANPIDWMMRNIPSKHHKEILEITMQIAQDAIDKGQPALQDKILTSAMTTAQQLKYFGKGNEALMIVESAIKHDLEYNHQPLIRWAIQQSILQINRIDETITWMEKNNCTINSQAPNSWLKENADSLNKMESQKVSESRIHGVHTRRLQNTTPTNQLEYMR